MAHVLVSRFRACLLPLLALLPLAFAAVGCSASETWRWEWHYYTVDAKKVQQEREKLASVVHDVLLHRSYYPESDQGLEIQGMDAVLVSHWNEEDARIQQGSYSGTRTQVAVRITEGFDHLRQHYPRDEVHARTMDAQYWRDGADQSVVISLGIATRKEINTRMNYIPGEITKAEWRPSGEDRRLMVLLFDQIRDRFNRIADRAVPEPGGVSERTLRIYEDDSRESSETAEPYSAIGPGTNQGSSGLDFGMRRSTRQ